MATATLDSRPVGGTEQSWCRAVSGGTGTAVLALSITKPPDISLLQTALHSLQTAHPILKTKLHSNPNKHTSFITPPSPPSLQITSFNLSTTSDIIRTTNNSVSPFHLILEHELNQDSWSTKPGGSEFGTDMILARVYQVSSSEWVVVFRLHVAACDRTTAVSLLKELLVLLRGGEVEMERGNGNIGLGIEELIPKGKANKNVWARGVDMLGYSVNSLRLTNLKFMDTTLPRCSQVVRLKMTECDTKMILAGCKSMEIKLCAVVAAAGLIAAHKSNHGPHHDRKYGVVTLVDCRSILDPALSSNHFGFYHSAILNNYTIRGEEKLWELANKIYTIFETSKKANKHFSDMADLNFLMCKAIQNPSLTSSSSLRTSYMSVFEDPVIDDDSNNTELKGEIGLEDYMGCASVHGIGPSIAIFDTIRGGRLDCVCVYPAPLHSRKQMQELVDNMKALLVYGCVKRLE